MAQLAAAVLATASATTMAAGESSGYARFSRDTDTIRIFGNTVFPGTDATYEMRVRLVPNAPATAAPRRLIAEQRSSLEDKTIILTDTLFIKETTRGYLCGGSNNAPLDSAVVTAWRHFAWVRQGSEARLYIDGVLAQTWANQSNCTTDSADSTMAIGMFRNGSPCCWSEPIPSFLGDLDWIRISTGARYTAEFTPPYECDIVSDAQTQLLLRFNEPAGTAELVDESPSAFVCSLGVPVMPAMTVTSPTLGLTAGGYPSCPCPCCADIDENGTIDGVDLAIVLGRWGTMPKDYPRADINSDGIVDGVDLAEVLGSWGTCQ
jgi:hypothetical protein